MSRNKNINIHFSTEFDAVIDRLSKFDPIAYASTRNYVNGAVSYLSPYISRGVISTKFVYQFLLQRGFKPNSMLKFIQELAWRDYWQQVWIAKGNDINTDLKQVQKSIVTKGISTAIEQGTTGINAIDNAIQDFYKTGYLHNHVRMYIASIACNVGKNYWKHPAQWMYYHLLDADWASNALSWQWVAGTNSNKKYFANQENINTFCADNQSNTFLDVDYADFENLQIPEVLIPAEIVPLTTPLPHKKEIVVDATLPTLIYNFYNMDPHWKKDIKANRILLLEPSHFNQYPVSKKSIDFILNLSKNIENMQLYVGEFNELTALYNLENIYYKEHPLNKHYRGTKEERDWMFSVKGYYPSFFAFWKKCQKEIAI